MININGKSYSGNNIVVSNNRVMIDGNDVTDDHDSKQIDIVVNGNMGDLTVDNAEVITINGNAQSVSTVNGGVACEDVSGKVSTVNGNVFAETIHGSVSTVNGDIKKG